MTWPSLDLAVDEGVATLVLDRPRALNAIDTATVAGLGEALDRVAVDDSIRALVLRGAGPHFSAGADIKEAIPAPEALLAQPAAAYPTARLMRLEKPSIAAISGYCLGGGLELALAADLRIAAADADFGFAEIDWGLTTGWGGGILLERIAGRAAALDLLLTGRRFGAQEALRLGLVTEIVEVTEFDARVRALAAQLASAAPEAVRGLKRVLRDDGFERDLEREVAAFAAVAHSPEARRRLAAFGRGDGDRTR